MNPVGIFDRTSDKIIFLPAFSLAFLSLQTDVFSLNIILESYEISFPYSIILYVASSIAILVLLEDMLNWTSEELRDSSKLIEYFLKDIKGVIRLIILILAITFTAVIYLQTTYQLFTIVPELTGNITTISIGYTLLIGQLVFLIDLNLGILLSRSHTEEVVDFKEKYDEIRNK